MKFSASLSKGFTPVTVLRAFFTWIVSLHSYYPTHEAGIVIIPSATKEVLREIKTLLLRLTAS